ncbi:MAG TPA: hypothetical protein VH420_00980 [Gaiellaceae bacterium]|jgi:hypothetical protein
MKNFGIRALLLLLAIVLFIVGALMDSSSENRVDIVYWGLAVFAASFIVESLPLGNLSNRNRS